ncbi:hypothetical protein ABB37_04859 [Leptomonas pyrrhocoris]|uniref:Uncharacterized protein n=1 Tax=Leptomonas pyrrhocoris TaxID=157538 RepID=A0A0N0DVV8_LEPPY|nr:hypothetical protein ABB37_04859 [Leptomonas pyrrhocoris]XP_015659119.1 hypothetical protein ABB37_04859 [Leptomonas pyrrhocoris]XP_015659120.1 hypothetical protein ABB37_04859 [Leptomonas pyrrhocoris]KPA80679.1 hypothetical protein ABB37_04859 [Leptomonas pyrrhocoris]KPA80680.1 hypothetical protein ABB37_04859 [Leptomonas pyrrhocoris]KPA80681.1 hypothetical protein ABB37_04859 [Leptomonas pyrrhocoris]|eukprot:XP_015659118.1 hypothetical protein ABB37_04859 [Leptomonas pyrrhocoris]
MTDKSAYGGLFQDPPYLSSDPDPKKTDPYDKQDCIPSRYLGKNMTVGGRTPHGDLPDAYFDKQYLTLASVEQNGGKPVGDDEDKWKNAAAAQHKKRAISDKEFRYSSYPHKSTGPGSYFGCFQDKPFEYMTEPWDDGSKSKKRKKKNTARDTEAEKTHLPNIKTGPSKKGTYGYPGLLLENPVYNEQWRADHDAAEREAAKKEQKQAGSAKPPNPPMHISGVSRAYLDEMPNTGLSGVYTRHTPPPDDAATRKQKAKKSMAAAAPVVLHEKPFTAIASRSGEQGCINAFPNAWVNPDDVKPSKTALLKQSQKAKEEAARMAKAPPVWKPNAFEKTSVVSSCLRRFY